MYNQTQNNKRITNTLLQHEESIFRDEPTKQVEVEKEKKSLPKPSFQKRQEKTVMEHIFYGVLFLITLISIGLNIYLVQFGATITSFIGAGLIVYCYQFTNPSRWKAEGREVAYWNVSVTLAVLLKSLHPKLIEWRDVLLWSLAAGVGIGFFLDGSLAGVFFGLYLILGLLFLAEKDVWMYSRIAFGLAWVSVLSFIVSLIVFQNVSIGALLMGLVLYQVHERVGELEIEYPEAE